MCNPPAYTHSAPILAVWRRSEAQMLSGMQRQGRQNHFLVFHKGTTSPDSPGFSAATQWPARTGVGDQEEGVN